jgi:hypothetical protein
LIVQSFPSTPGDAATYHSWYDEVHLPEILALDGFVSARRLSALDGGSFVAVYEIDGDVEVAKANLTAAMGSGSMSRPSGVRTDPPPSVQWWSDFDVTHP